MSDETVTRVPRRTQLGHPATVWKNLDGTFTLWKRDVVAVQLDEDELRAVVEAALDLREPLDVDGVAEAALEQLRERARNAEQAEEELRDLLRAIVIPVTGACPVCNASATYSENHADGCAWAEARRVLERDGVELDG